MDPLTIALAVYGGYQGYKSSKGGSPLARIASTALGAYGGYNLGSGITGSAIGQEYLPSFLTEKVTPSIGEMFSGINAFKPSLDIHVSNPAADVPREHNVQNLQCISRASCQASVTVVAKMNKDVEVIITKYWIFKKL
jgi:hypothetical protein